MDQDERGAVHAAVRVFLLDDHEMVRLGLREMLEQSSDITVVGEAARADEALRRIPAVEPDVAVLDFGMPTRPPSRSPRTRALTWSSR